MRYGASIADGRKEMIPNLNVWQLVVFATVGAVVLGMFATLEWTGLMTVEFAVGLVIGGVLTFFVSSGWTIVAIGTIGVGSLLATGGDVGLSVGIAAGAVLMGLTDLACKHFEQRQ